MTKYSSDTNHLRFFLRCHHSKVLPEELKSRIKIEQCKIILHRAGKLLLREQYLWNMLYVIDSGTALDS